jgi:pilus assembly protein CpaC
VRWPAEYQAQVLPKFSAGPEPLLATLRALEARGRAQILASPNLLCRSGSEAKFHAGGEFPIRIFSRNSRDVIWKQHGVLLRVRPRADFQGAISLELETEVSLLDMAGAVDGIPALKSNSVRSHFDLPGRRTIALSGLLRQEIGDARDGLPYLMNLPVLGRLFSSAQYLKRQSELVIFVTPEIHVPESDEKIEMPAGWVRDEP